MPARLFTHLVDEAALCAAHLGQQIRKLFLIPDLCLQHICIRTKHGSEPMAQPALQPKPAFPLMKAICQQLFPRKRLSALFCG